jgi:ribosomal protein L9
MMSDFRLPKLNPLTQALKKKINSNNDKIKEQALEIHPVNEKIKEDLERIKIKVKKKPNNDELKLYNFQ